VWFCQDVHNNAHLWGADGSHHLIPASVYLTRKGPTNSDEYFRVVYPDVPFPERPTS
jgi:hypothetical protein